MQLEAQKVVSVPSLGSVKMEDRKRLVADHEESPRPTKRQNTLTNGAKSESTAESLDSKDIETFQKDAIIRQMREYKREKERLESQLSELEKSSKHYQDHLLIIDAWFGQMIDEIRILVSDITTLGSENNDTALFPESLVFSDSEHFQTHLASRTQKIKDALSSLFARLPPSAPEVAQLQQKLSSLLAKEREHIVDLQRVTSEKDQLQERLETASYRYMVAEKKLDRAQSAAVAKWERQATQSTKAPADDSTRDTPKDEVNGVESSAGSEGREVALKEALAASAKRQEQLEQLEAENKKLTAEVTTLNTRLSGLSDDDYAKSDLFKAIKTQYEDVIKRINHLEATNVMLREEAQKLHAERTAYRMQMDEESRSAIAEVEGQLAKAEIDLARIRTARDDLQAENSILKATQNEQKASFEQIKELASAKEDRVTALEKEVELLRLQVGDVQPSEHADMDAMGHEELVLKVRSLEQQIVLLSSELQSMESAWKKAQALASKKVAELSSLEEQVSRLAAEKAKADQKYFGAMKAKEAREAENRTLRMQNSKSSEIITQLKDAETTRLTQRVNAENQLAAARESIEHLTNQQLILQQKVNHMTVTSDSLASTVAEHKKLLAAKDEQLSAQVKTNRNTEVELEKVKSKIAELEKRNEELRKKAAGHQTDQDVMLRRIVYCNDHKTSLKNTVLKPCGHVLCDKCVDELIRNRNRKCPHCKKAFGIQDYMRVHLDT